MGLSTPADLLQAATAAGISLRAPESERLVAYAELLMHWNRSINLTASATLAEILERQVLDCLMVERLPWASDTVEAVDIGSGAGLPGLLLAILHPGWSLTSLERVAKKATFQQEAVRVLALPNVTVLREDAAQHAAESGHGRYDVAFSRAFADLARTLPLAAELLRSGGVLRTYKGRKLREEQMAIPAEIRARFASEVFERGYSIPGSDVAGFIVEYRKL
jgi:16S rRNA (guanine527-N7)-methyltransferase